MKFDTI